MRRAPSPRRSSANCSRAASRTMIAEHVLLARDRFGKTLLGDIRRDRQARIERLMLVAKRAVELAQQVGAEARGQRRARQVDDVADALQADACERRDGRRRKPQRGERQRREQFAFVAAGIARRLAVMRGGPGGADGAGNGERIGEAGALQPAAEIGDQFVARRHKDARSR